MKTRKFFSFLMAVMAVAMTAVTVSSCGSDDDDNGGGTSGSGIYGTWVSTLEDGEVFTVVIAPNSMQLQWAYDGGSETEVYDSFSYDESTHKVIAHHCKSIYAGQGYNREDAEDDILEFYVNWIDNNHITIGGKPGEVWDDYGTLTRK
ncbi:MAG: hypothetical protein ACI4BA_03085 [Prevotella sp.]